MYVSNLNQFQKKNQTNSKQMTELGLGTWGKRSKVPNLPICVLKIKGEGEDCEGKWVMMTNITRTSTWYQDLY